MNPFWRNHRPDPDSTMCTWDLNYRCKRICKCCICRKCKGSGHHCHCEEEDLPAVKAPQPSGDAVVEPPTGASGQSSEAYLWTPGQDTSCALQPIPATSQPPMPPPKSEAAPQSPTAEERVELLEYQAFAAEKRNQELQAQWHHLRGLYFGPEARVRQLENASGNPWKDLE